MALTIIDGSISYPIDAAVTESHKHKNTVTREPVEDGVDITDTVQIQADERYYDCVVSDNPLDAAIISFRQQYPTGGLYGAPSLDAYLYLTTLRNNPRLVTIVDSLGTWPNMMLEDLTVPRSIDKSTALYFSVTFVQVVIVSNERTIVKVAVPRAAKTVAKGNAKVTNPATPPAKDEKSHSALWRLKHASDLDGIGE